MRCDECGRTDALIYDAVLGDTTCVGCGKVQGKFSKFKVFGRTFNNENFAVAFAQMVADRSGESVLIYNAAVEPWTAPYPVRTIYPRVANETKKV